ncbi:MAG: response regulator transcription factor [Hamadaea sp.]|uniref:response regulator n=1 Tax=Hamadaea sp. TaxID=2024425 RepID=UPI0018066268|nr:response regulator transcription factor [Hamadaea sp.]NUR48105.1 response regulator transcription factor [Hamadaea sp.]NUR69695.1 response regulator transcription factor [Hamadaea sp.]NUT19562.1 response regulator transcription factor [Hamadaea sp.]
MRLMLVDDHVVVRAGLRALLESQPGVEVVAETGTGEQAVSLAAALQPEVVLMDLQLGSGIDGVEATRRLLELDPSPRVLVLTTYDSDADVVRAMAAGAVGYILKDIAPDALFRAIEDAAAGRTALSAAVAGRLARQVHQPGVALSARETEIVTLLAEGLTNQQIARRLLISEATVKTHLVHIFGKLGVDSRTAAVTEAVNRRLITLRGRP